MTTTQSDTSPNKQQQISPQTSREQNNLHTNHGLPRKAQTVIELPNELIFYIFSFLDITDLNSATLSCTAFKNVADDCIRIIQGDGTGNTWREQYYSVASKREHKQRVLYDASNMFNHGLQKQAVQKMISEKVVSDTPFGIAKYFLRNPFAKLTKHSIIDFLLQKENTEILQEYFLDFEFTGVDIPDALRYVLCYFDLMSKNHNTQQISLLIEAFSKSYYSQNKGKTLCVNAVAVSNLAYGIFSLFYTETGIKRSVILSSRKFVENNKGVNDGKDFPTSFLENIYDRVLHTGLDNKIGTVIKSGWLHKQGNDLLRIWKRRYFILVGYHLIYYKKPGDTEILGRVSLRGVAVQKTKGKKATFELHKNLSLRRESVAFDKETIQRRNERDLYVLAADTEEEAEQWIKIITRISTTLQNGGRPGTLRPKRTYTSRNLGMRRATRNSGAAKPRIEGIPGPYFGVPLQQILDREKKEVPLLVFAAIQYLERALDEEGILRLSGSSVEIQAIREQIAKGNLDFTGRDPHAVSSVLKSWFRELPSPLFDKETNDGASAVITYGEGEEVKSELRHILLSLPKSTVDLLKVLIAFLRKVVDHSNKNKMNMNNILRVVTPTLNCIPGFISFPVGDYDYFFGEPAIAAAQQPAPAEAPEEYYPEENANLEEQQWTEDQQYNQDENGGEPVEGYTDENGYTNAEEYYYEEAAHDFAPPELFIEHAVVDDTVDHDFDNDLQDEQGIEGSTSPEQSFVRLENSGERNLETSASTENTSPPRVQKRNSLQRSASMNAASQSAHLDQPLTSSASSETAEVIKKEKKHKSHKKHKKTKETDDKESDGSLEKKKKKKEHRERSLSHSDAAELKEKKTKKEHKEKSRERSHTRKEKREKVTEEETPSKTENSS